MAVGAFVAVAFGASALAFLARPLPRLGAAIGLAGLAACLVLALLLTDGEGLSIGGERLTATAYLRVFLALGAAVALLLCLLGLATGGQHHVAGVYAAALGAAAAALALPASPSAALAATIGGVGGILVAGAERPDPGSVRVASRYLRAVAAAGALAVVASVWLSGIYGAIPIDPLATGVALVTMALALAIRFGAFPFHAWAARLAETAPQVAVPLLLAWLPAILFAVALAWSHQVVLPQTLELPIERGAIIGLGILTLVLGAVGSWIQDDVDHVVGYSVVQDAGFFLIAFGALDRALWEPARTWLFYFVLAKSALAGWVAAVRAIHGTDRLPELDGWARRSPLLAIGLVAALATGLGVPGLASWDARLAILEGATDGPARWLAFAGWGLGYVAAGRILLVGLRRQGERARAAADQRPHRPPPEPSVSGPLPHLLRLVRLAAATWETNRLPLATGLVLALALLGLVLAVAPGPIPVAAQGGPPLPSAGLAPGP